MLHIAPLNGGWCKQIINDNIVKHLISNYNYIIVCYKYNINNYLLYKLLEKMLTRGTRGK